MARIVVWSAILLSVAAVRSSAADVALERMFYRGESAPGVAGSLAFRDGGPIIGTSNGAAFAGVRVRLQGASVTSGTARTIYRGSPGNYEYVARAGAQAPGLATGIDVGAINIPFADLGADASGRFAFAAQLSGPGVSAGNDVQTYVVDVDGDVLPLVREGDRAPGFAQGVTMSPPTAVAFRPDGSVVFRASLSSGPVSQAIFAGTPGGLAPLPQMQTPGGMDVVELGNPQVDFGGRIVFTGATERAVYDPTVGVWEFASRQTIITGNPTVESIRTARNGLTLGGKLVGGLESAVFGQYDNVAIIAQQGQAAVGLPGVQFAGFNEFEVGDSGGVFMAELQGAGVTASNNVALYAADANGVRLLVRQGDHAPGFDAGTVVTSWPSSYRVNNMGGFRIDGLIVNDGGNSVSVAYAIDPSSGALFPALWTGETIEFAPGDLRQIAQFSTTNEISDSNSFAANIVFTDNSEAEYLVTIVPSEESLLGDYNGDHVIDAADYTIWCDTLGSTTDLRANGDDTGASAGVVDLEDFAVWKVHFGETSEGGFGTMARVVPEPATTVLLLSGWSVLCFRRKRRDGNWKRHGQFCGGWGTVCRATRFVTGQKLTLGSIVLVVYIRRTLNFSGRSLTIWTT